MLIDNKFITSKVQPGKVYVPPLVKVHRLVDVRIMAGSIRTGAGGTDGGQGDDGFC